MRYVFLLASLVGWLFTTGLTVAEEPTREFLEQLRQKGEYELALEHIAALEKKDGLPAAVRTSLNLERGVTLLQQAKKEASDTKKREQLLAAADSLQRYLDQRPGPLLELQAQVHLSMAAVEHGRQLLKNAEDAPEELRPELAAAGRVHYAKAIKLNEAIVQTSGAQLKTPEVMANPNEQDEFRKQLLQGRLLVAAATEEMADSHPPASEERLAGLEKAAREYEDIYAAYRTRLAGLYARLYQGRCWQKLAKHDKAIQAFNELLANPDAPEPFRVLKIKVLDLAANSWLATERAADVVLHLEPLLSNLRPNEEKSAEIASLRAKLATAKTALEAAKK